MLLFGGGMEQGMSTSCSKSSEFVRSPGTALQLNRSHCQGSGLVFDFICTNYQVSCFSPALAFCRRTHTRAALHKSSSGNGLQQNLGPHWLCGVKFSPSICWRNSSITLLLQSFYLPLANSTAKKVICLKQK